MTDLAPRSRLFRDRDFATFFSGQLLSGLGDAIAFVAMPLLVLRATGSVTSMGVATAASLIGMAAAHFVSGALVDRIPRRRLMIGCDVARALGWFAVYTYWRVAGPRVDFLYAIAAGSAFVGNVFQVACVAVVPRIVARDLRGSANGAVQATYALASLIGPVASGVACDRFGPLSAIAINAGSFVASALSIAAIGARLDADPIAPPREATAWRDLTAGARFVWQEPTLRASALLMAFGALTLGGYLDVVIFDLKDALHRSDRDVGLLLALASAGGVLGGLSAARLLRRIGFGACWLGAWLVFGGSLAAAGAIGSYRAMCAFGVALGFAEVLRSVVATSFRQEVTPEHLLGRVTAASWAASDLPRPIGAAVATLVAARIAAPHTLVILGGACVALAAVGCATAVGATTWPRSSKR